MASGTLGAALRQIHTLFDLGNLAALTDPQLLERFLIRGDADAFEALVIRHGPMVQAVCWASLIDPDDAEDAFQATFLVLVQKAHSIRRCEVLGGWLHRIARRVAARANADAARRRELHRIAATRAELETRPQVGEDPQTALHDEIDRLPEKLRLPVVLCELEGLTQPQAASQLGCGEATVRRRLTDARHILKRRLTQRGVAPSLGILGGSATIDAVAAVPEAWVHETSRVVQGALANSPAVSASVASLAKGALRSLWSARIISAGASTLSLAGVIAILGGLALSDEAKDMPPARSSDRPKPRAAQEATKTVDPTPSAPENETVSLVGRVLDPEGKPFVGAAITVLPSFYFANVPEPTPAARTWSDAAGGFKVSFAKSQIASISNDPEPWRKAQVIAAAEGYGPDWDEVGSIELGGEMILRLVKDDVPIVDLEGHPIAGLAVKATTVTAPNHLERWIKESFAPVAEAPKDLTAKRLLLVHWTLARSATTGGDGRFQLEGFGRDRVVGLGFEGASIEKGAGVWAATRPGPATETGPELKRRIHGPTFEYAAAPGRQVIGIVRDKSTHQPLPGIHMAASRVSSSGNPGGGAWATTDAKGAYRLDGLPLGSAYRLNAGPGPGMPYLNSTVSLPERPGAGPIVADVELGRGVAIRGRLIDKATGKPVRGAVFYVPTATNPRHAEIVDTTSTFLRDRMPTGADGEFQTVGLPGRGLLVASASDAGRFTTVKPESFAEPAEPITSPFVNTIMELDVPEGVESFSRDVTFDPGRTISMRLFDPEGRRLAGTVAFGLRSLPDLNAGRPLDGATCTVRALTPGQPRLITFQHPGRRLGTFLMLQGDEQGAYATRLVPCASIAGRLVDADGKPRPHFEVSAVYNVPALSGTPQSIPPNWPSATTDADGKFRIEGLLAYMPYNLSAYSRKAGSYSVLVEGFKPQPGETRDMGNVRGKAE